MGRSNDNIKLRKLPLKVLFDKRDRIFSGLRLLLSYYSGYEITPKPRHLTYETTYQCNCRCIFCKRWKVGLKNIKNELTTEQALNMVKGAKKIGVKFISFSGGEPMLRKDLFEVANYTKKNGINTYLNTNGVLITEKNIERVIDSFDGISISIDSVNPSKHDHIRGLSGAFKKALNAVDLISKYTDNIKVGMVVTTENVDEIEEYAKFFRERGIGHTFQPVHSNPANLLVVNDEKIRKFGYNSFKKKWMGIFERLNLNDEYYLLFPEFLCRPHTLVNRFVCFAGSRSIFINPYGEVFPCESLRISQGNVKKEPLTKIWKDMKELRKFLSSKERKCICWWACTARRYLRLTKLMRLDLRGLR